MSLTTTSGQVSAFSNELLNQVGRANEFGNILVSPVSIYMALSVLVAASDGKTRDQLKKVLNYDRIHNELADEMNHNLIRKLNSRNSSVETVFLQSVFLVNSSVKLWPILRDWVEKRYFSKMKTVNFRKFEKVDKKIQKWIDTASPGFKPESVYPDFGDDSLLVIMNAFSFRGKWPKDFEASKTPRPFVTERGETKQVDFIEQVLSIAHSQLPLNNNASHKVQIARIPLKGNTSMFILKPVQPFSVSSILSWKELSNLIYRFTVSFPKNRTGSQVMVAIPKLNISSNIQLATSLQNMGLVGLFNRTQGDLSKVLVEKDKPFFLSSFDSVVAFKLAEFGIQSISLTGNEGKLRRLKVTRNVEQFVLDRPFIFVIYDEVFEMQLLAARITDPTELTALLC